MKRRGVKFRPQGAEALESLTMMSGVGAAMSEVSPRSANATSVALRTTFHGSYSTTSFPDVGTTYHLEGAGKEAPRGHATLAGDLHSTGFIMNGHATGTLTVSDPKGTIHLALTGPTQPGFATLPGQFSFVIASGTGHYAHAKGSGTAHVTLFPALGLGSATQTGAFTISLKR
jgi:hypothetical protein